MTRRLASFQNMIACCVYWKCPIVVELCKNIYAKFVSNPGGGLGDEAVRVVKLLKFTPPGYRFQTQIPVNFSLK